ncbi:MAG: hypothetical protein HKP61_13630 [Dactylosporangium sp.]|nr:hypothetical protein [Dactylosporangium sp.]NNJ61954.1 hypothetical protein [Dactylosporangium sp.]
MRPAELVVGLAALAERIWRPMLLFAAVLFASSGIAHAFGQTDAVFYAALAGVALGGVAVGLGLLALRATVVPPEEDPL